MSVPKGMRPGKGLYITMGLVLVAGLGFVQRGQDAYFEISKNLDVFGKILREVSITYVDEVEVNALARKGYEAMLASLDPFTNFISASEIEDYRFQSTGEYGGIGARIAIINNQVTVTEPYPNQPAHRAGLRSGDVITQIDDEQVEGREFTAQDITNLLRGEAGKSVVVKFRKPGQTTTQVATIIRDHVKIPSVPYAGLAAPGLGYISLSGFTKDAGQEVANAFQKLKTDHPDLKGIILDLRGNPGGLLVEAIRIANLFVPKGELIVETRGRLEGSLQRFKAENNPADLTIPIVVLINKSSASASEIVSGVLQDLDRGVVVGQKSYGKGLVQQTRPLSFNNQIKITTSRYFTPSGRCIQAINYSHSGADAAVVRTPDSLRQQFRTRNGRKVLDAGGILPDVQLEPVAFHEVTHALVAKNMIFQFITQYVLQNPSSPGLNGLAVTDEIYSQFVAFVREKNFTFDSPAFKSYDKFREQLREEAYYAALQPQMDELKRDLETQRDRDILNYRSEIERILLAELAFRYHGNEGRMARNLGTDPEVQEAVRLLQDQTRYQQLLASPGGLGRR